MAKKKDNTTVAIIAALAVFLLTSRRSTAQRPPIRNYPPPPPRTGSAWGQWAQTILRIYGDVKELWEPEGPFHNVDPERVYDAVNQQDYSGYA